MTFIAYCVGKQHSLHFRNFFQANDWHAAAIAAQNHFGRFPNFDVIAIGTEEIS